MRVLLVLGLLGALGACANMPLTESGFLSSYEELAPAEERLVWGVPDAMLLVRHAELETTSFRAVHVAPVRFVPTGERAAALEEDDRRQLREHLERALREELGRELELAEAPGPGVLTLRAAVTDAEPITPWVNWVMVVLLVPTSYGGISGEMELLDDQGRRLAAMTAAREGTAFLLLECFDRWGHARHSAEKWAAEWRRILSGD